MIIHVVDDNGNILDATVTVNGIEYQTKDGSLTITEIGEISPEVLVSYLGNEKSINVNLLQDPDYTVIFDRTPPQILSIDLDSSGEVMKLVITAEDPGKQPSGIELEGIIVRYQYEGEWITANVYKELGVYVGELTKTNPGSVVYFEVTIQDKEGLKQIQNGHFSIPSDNGGTNHSNGGNGDNGDGEGGFDLLTIGLVVIFIVILYIIIKKLMGSGE